MSGKRASIFDAEEELDVSDFVPKRAVEPAVRKDNKDKVKAVAEAAHFPSREPQQDAKSPTTTKREPRRYRTGRNIQLNIKARADAIDAFYTIADRQGWVLGEAFEHAVDALKRDIETKL
jgi:hypothetical protein